jgi:hypothetical protein
MEQICGSTSVTKGCLRILGVPDRFIQRASRQQQFIEAGISADNIREAVKEVMHHCGRRKRKRAVVR